MSSKHVNLHALNLTEIFANPGCNKNATCGVLITRNARNSSPTEFLNNCLSKNKWEV